MKQSLRYGSVACFLLVFLRLSCFAQSQDYLYDLNGNLSKDVNKGLDTLIYNFLNLVETVKLSGNRGVITYRYNANGAKLSKTVTDSKGNTTLRYYVYGVEYDGNKTLQFVATEEGRVSSINNDFHYEYNFKDHLSNTRVRFTEDEAHQIKVLQTNGYYPFGGDQAGMYYVSGPENKYLLGGKEQQGELQLYDFGARLYDPSIGRWWASDPKAEKYYAFSAYNYTLNNPLKFIDPDGKEPRFVPGTSEEFKKRFYAAAEKSPLYEKIQTSPEVTKVQEGYLKNAYDPRTHTLTWDPYAVEITTSGYKVSPAETLNHEFAHRLQQLENKKQMIKDARTPAGFLARCGYNFDDDDDMEEVRVIIGELKGCQVTKLGPEAAFAQQLGKLPKGNFFTRKDHKMVSDYLTADPNSTDPMPPQEEMALRAKRTETERVLNQAVDFFVESVIKSAYKQFPFELDLRGIK